MNDHYLPRPGQAVCPHCSEQIMANFDAPTAEWLTVRLWCPTCRGRWVEVRAVGERPRRFWKRTAAPVPA